MNARNRVATFLIRAQNLLSETVHTTNNTYSISWKWKKDQSIKKNSDVVIKIINKLTTSANFEHDNVKISFIKKR